MVNSWVGGIFDSFVCLGMVCGYQDVLMLCEVVLVFIIVNYLQILIDEYDYIVDFEFENCDIQKLCLVVLFEVVMVGFQKFSCEMLIVSLEV